MEPRRFTDLPVAILCGGLGTRLGPIAADIPKSLVKVAGRPFIHWQLDHLKEQGFTKIVLCLGHKAEQIVNATKAYDVKCRFDGGTPRGTGGAIKHALTTLGDQFYVLYGDSYLPISYEPLFKWAGISGTGNCMSYYKGIDYGINLYKRQVFDELPERFDINIAQFELRRTNRTATWNSPESFHEIGSPAGLAEVEKLLSKKPQPQIR